MRKLLASCVVLILGSCAAFASDFSGAAAMAGVPAAHEETVKQSVFLFCPHKEGAGAWSLYAVADKNDPSKILALGLEELSGKNSKENTYKGVLNAQKDPSTPRSELSHLDAREFSGGRLQGKDLLSIKVEPVSDYFKLTIDARVSSDGHFVVGGPEQGRRDVILKYSSVYKTWQAKALKLEDVAGQNAVGKYAMTLTGIVFTVGTTMVSRICAVDEFGKAVMLMDR
ncbi:MAG TPA: hypothetical protein VKX17_25095 [Planctomycetota bacterium]|nr:hypothetical protein [Planctomycetota bacterium]